MSISRNELNKMEMAVAEIIKTSKAEQEKIEKEREALSAQKTALDNDRATVQAESQAVAVEKANAQRMKEEAENMLEKAYSTAEICNQIISEEKKLNAKFMEFLDDEGKRMNKKIREYVEYLYNKFQKARRDSFSDWQSEMWRIRNERLRQKSPDTDNSPDIIDTNDTDTGYSFSL